MLTTPVNVFADASKAEAEAQRMKNLKGKGKAKAEDIEDEDEEGEEEGDFDEVFTHSTLLLSDKHHLHHKPWGLLHDFWTMLDACS